MSGRFFVFKIVSEKWSGLEEIDENRPSSAKRASSSNEVDRKICIPGSLETRQQPVEPNPTSSTVSVKPHQAGEAYKIEFAQKGHLLN